MTTLPPIIEHIREIIQSDDGGTEQIYNHLIYRFGNPVVVVARAYFDEPNKVAVITGAPLSDEVMTYLQDRFDEISELGASGAYETVWRS